MLVVADGLALQSGKAGVYLTLPKTYAQQIFPQTIPLK